MDTAIIPGLQVALQDTKGKNPLDSRRLTEVATAGLYVAETPWREGGVEKSLGDNELTDIGC